MQNKTDAIEILKGETGRMRQWILAVAVLVFRSKWLQDKGSQHVAVVVMAATVPSSVRIQRRKKQGNNGSSNTRDKSSCRLYLAPSTTGTESEPKYGLYAGKEYLENDTIPNSELGIPLVGKFVVGRNPALLLPLEDFTTSRWQGTAKPRCMQRNPYLTLCGNMPPAYLVNRLDRRLQQGYAPE